MKKIPVYTEVPCDINLTASIIEMLNSASVNYKIHYKLCNDEDVDIDEIAWSLYIVKADFGLNIEFSCSKLHSSVCANGIDAYDVEKWINAASFFMMSISE